MSAGLVLDLETVVDETLWAEPLPCATCAGKGEVVLVNTDVPVALRPCPACDGVRHVRPFPPLHAHRIVCVGMLALPGPGRSAKLGIARGDDEASQLREAARILDDMQPTLVTWNGRGFDLPVIELRALHHGIVLPTSRYRDRYRSQHIDMMEAVSNYGAAKRLNLDDVARLCGLPGKGDTDGSQVGAMVAAGRIEEVRAYCLRDVVQTALVWLRWGLRSGDISRDAYRDRASAVLARCEAEPLLAAWAAQLDRRAMMLEDAPVAQEVSA